MMENIMYIIAAFVIIALYIYQKGTYGWILT